MNDFVRKHSIFIGYVLIGTMATLLDMGVLYLLSDVIGWDAILSNCISVFLGISLSFILNSKFNFKKTERIIIKFIYFFSVCLIGMMIGSAIFEILYVELDMIKFLSKLISVITSGILQYLFNKNVTFR
ncbi:MAG: GtrA family protein [Clostridia bacterium]|jgi:putative flippase GtrA